MRRAYRWTFYETIIFDSIEAIARFETRLNGLHDGARAQAAGADADSSIRPPLNRPDSLQIGVPPTRGSVVGMAHTVAHLGFFPANFTCPSHFVPPEKINSRGIPAYLVFITQN